MANSLTGLPSCLPPGPVIIFEFTSHILMATVIDSEPEFIQMNLENGQLSLVCPNSFFSAAASLACEIEGVMTLAMT